MFAIHPIEQQKLVLYVDTVLFEFWGAVQEQNITFLNQTPYYFDMEYIEIGDYREIGSILLTECIFLKKIP